MDCSTEPWTPLVMSNAILKYLTDMINDHGSTEKICLPLLSNHEGRSGRDFRTTPALLPRHYLPVVSLLPTLEMLSHMTAPF